MTNSNMPLVLSSIKGVGPKTVEKLNKLGVNSVVELENYYPRTYHRFALPTDYVGARDRIGDDFDDGLDSIEVIFPIRPKSVKLKNGKMLTTAIAYDKTGKKISIKWFNATYLDYAIDSRKTYVIHGRMEEDGSMAHPLVKEYTEYISLTHTLNPIYSLKAGISNNIIVKAIMGALNDYLPKDYLSDDILKKTGLISLGDALLNIHFPKDTDMLIKARRRLAFDEFYSFYNDLNKLLNEKIKLNNDYIVQKHEEIKAFISSLPYKLTDAQNEAYEDIMKDLSSGYAMKRLLQGDVGCGKTITAFLAILETVLEGFQCAFMAPTEILARQHYEKLNSLLEGKLDVRVGLLSGAMSAAEKKAIKSALKEHEIDIIIGTHALIEDDIIFDELALVVIDEQHRFGVRQREKLFKMNNRPHVLIMSATPIPRTLALMLYGDLELSVIGQMPSGRKKIKTAVIEKNLRENSYRLIAKEVANSHQAMIICPMIEDNEDFDVNDVNSYTDKLRDVFTGSVRIMALHGKMKAEEKNAIMAAFARGEIDILVSTTVIEVGIDVPNATVIMVENAERFGLATLHQLRGRVGRGADQGYCILVNNKPTEVSKKRLQIMFDCDDGFKVAEEDMKSRGPGDIFGIRQSGDMSFRIANIYQDADLLKLAKELVESNESNSRKCQEPKA